MKSSLLSLPLLLFFAGCATPREDTAISRIVQALERHEAEALAKNSYEEFPYGSSQGLILPSNAPPQQVAAEAMRRDGWSTNDITVVATRMVRIRPPQGLDKLIAPADLQALLDRRARTTLTAVVVKTSVGERVVLMEFFPPAGSTKTGFNTGCWFYKTYDPERVLKNSLQPANSRAAARLLVAEFHC